MDDITIRLALGVAIIAACALAGRAVARADKRRAQILAETMDGMQLLKIHMLDNLMPLGAALEKSQAFILKETGRYVDGRGAREAWHEVKRRETARGGKLDSLSDSDCEVLERFFMQLGNSSHDEQRQGFDAAIKEIGILEDISRSSGGQKNRLYTALGALAGAAVAVAII